MGTSKQQLCATTADASEDRRVAAIRILLALAEVSRRFSAEPSKPRPGAGRLRRGGAA